MAAPDVKSLRVERLSRRRSRVRVPSLPPILTGQQERFGLTAHLPQRLCRLATSLFQRSLFCIRWVLHALTWFFPNGLRPFLRAPEIYRP